MKTALVLLLTLVSVSGYPRTKQKRYDGHQVLKVIPKVFEHFKDIENLGHKYNLDFWNHPKRLNDTFDIHVSPDDVTKVIEEVKALGADVNVWIKDLQTLIDDTMPSPRRQERASSSHLSMHHYHSYDEINAFLNGIVASNSHAHLYKIGTSVQGRSINLIRFSTGQTSTGEHKKSIFMDGGIHAREWIAPAVVLYVIDQLANNPNGDASISDLLDKFDWYLVPLVNPDGYEHSRHGDRMWRKNMSPNYGTHHDHFGFGCGSDEMGVDLNRNFNFHWDPRNGGSLDQCQETYAGPKPLSEPETRAIANTLDTVASHTLVYLNTHNYGQYWIYPWGYTSTLPHDASDLDHLARVVASAIYGVHGTRYTVGEDTRVLYPAAGGADDYAKGHSGIKYAYTVELGDTGHYGFLLPERYIQSSGEETWAGIKAMAFELARLYNI